jgi:hypothetical protein
MGILHKAGPETHYFHEFLSHPTLWDDKSGPELTVFAPTVDFGGIGVNWPNSRRL